MNSFVDEDGFKPRKQLITAFDTKDNTSEDKVRLKDFVKADAKTSVSTPMSKDVQFLLKVKKFRRNKLLGELREENRT